MTYTTGTLSRPENRAQRPGLKLSPVHLARFRRPDLKAWAAAIEIIVRHDRARGIPLSPEALRQMTRVVVEHDQIMGRLDVFGGARLDWLADLFGVSPNAVKPHWNEAVTESARYHELAYIAAHARLDRTGEAQLYSHKLTAGPQISAAFDLTVERKRLIFKPVNGKRRNTRLPTYKPERETGERWTVEKIAYTRAEHRDWTGRLGFKADTISQNARTLTETEFRARIAKREAETLPADLLEGRKLAGESDWHASVRIRKEAPHTRNRAFGVTAARRAYAQAMGVSKITSLRQTKGLTADEIMARLVDPKSRAVTHDTDSGVTLDTDKTHRDRPFPGKFLSDHNTTGTDGHQVSDTDLSYLREHWRRAHGKELSAATIRQWRSRRKLKDRVYAACEWLAAHANIEPGLAQDAEAVAQAMQDAHRARKRMDAVNRSLRFGPMFELQKPAA
ncbi:hypothetical protein ABS771_20010 [Methylobacterium brachiatum]|uniref:Uncharacterized protein n=1 Tax=Methylobacterium brachiatum TaxID=269660 RepID=A0ABV1R4U2_9HYPH